MSSAAYDSRGLVRFDNIDIAVMGFLESHDEDIDDALKRDVVRRLRLGRRMWRLVRFGRGAVSFLCALFFVMVAEWAVSLIFLDFQMMFVSLVVILAELFVEHLLRISISNLSSETNMTARDILADVTEESNRIVFAVRRGLPAGDSDV